MGREKSFLGREKSFLGREKSFFTSQTLGESRVSEGGKILTILKVYKNKQKETLLIVDNFSFECLYLLYFAKEKGCEILKLDFLRKWYRY